MLGHAIVRTKYGHKLERLLGLALSNECEDVWLEKREAQNFQHPNNTLCFTNAKKVAKDCKYQKLKTLLTKVELYQSPEEKASWNADSGVKMLPYKFIHHRSNPYRDDMIFKVQCKFFYTDGLVQIAKLAQSIERSEMIPIKKDRGPEWDALGWNPTQEGRQKGDITMRNGKRCKWNGTRYVKLCIVAECKCEAKKKEMCNTHNAMLQMKK